MFERLVKSLATKPFVILTGNSGTGKTKMAELLAHWLRGGRPGGYALVAVGADWTDSRNVLGFVNYLRESRKESGSLPVYQSTLILDLLLEAGREENSKLPYFLILDEMNLSHVERYFADFLSAMESKSGALHLHSEGKEKTRLSSSFDGDPRIPQILEFPKNVFVVGTVNVDETTYMFSPKVLDRANVIEFRMELDVVEDFLKTGGSGITSLTWADQTYAESFLELSQKVRSDAGGSLGNGQDLSLQRLEPVNDKILELFKIMAAEKQEFGYRTIKEIIRYFRVDYALTEEKADWSWELVFDVQILQKVLPKLHGSRRKIEGLLIQLATFCESGAAAIPGHLKSSPIKRADTPRYPQSYKKLCEMIDTVRRDQFVSFIQ